MNFKWLKPMRLLSISLVVSMAFGTSALAAGNQVEEADEAVPVIVETDTPIEVGDLVTGTALGVGTATKGVNVRENPNMDAAVVTILGVGQKVVILSQEGEWYRVSSEGMTGFVKCDYMTLTEEGEGQLGYAKTKEGEVLICAEVGADDNAVGTAVADDVIEILGVDNGWYKVSVNDTVGYVCSDEVDPTVHISAEEIYDYAVIACGAANIRSNPEEDASKVDTLFTSSLCTLLGEEDGWYKVQYGDVVGYVKAELTSTTNDESAGSTQIETGNEAAEREAREAEEARRAAEEEERRRQQESTPAPATPTPTTPSNPTPSTPEPSYDPAPSSDGSSIVSVAKNYLGVPYVWGGTSPSGFDCSGFTQYVFRQCGYSINRTADAQYSNGSYVSYDNLSAGDLVFFCNTYSASGITHVGIYIGGGQFIHSASGGVKISSLSESYYSSRYYGARRIG